MFFSSYPTYLFVSNFLTRILLTRLTASNICAIISVVNKILVNFAFIIKFIAFRQTKIPTTLTGDRYLVGEGGFARLRAGRSAALTRHQRVIHSRSPSNPQNKIPNAFAFGILVGEGGFEPPKSVTTDLQSAPFDRSGIPQYSIGAGGRIRTPDLLITNQLLYQLSYTSEVAVPTAGFILPEGFGFVNIFFSISRFLRRSFFAVRREPPKAA